jgi:energy-converting hydrogenase Eha subunit C
MTYAMLSLVGSICAFLGIILYSKWFNQFSLRSLMKWGIICGIISQCLYFCLVLQLNSVLGIPNAVFMVGIICIMGTVDAALSILPPNILFTEITPLNIEATMFGMTSSLLNLSMNNGPKGLGLMINLLVGVTSTNMNHYYILVLISFPVALIPFFFLHLVPSQEEI